MGKRFGLSITLFFLLDPCAAATDTIRIAVSNPNMPNLTSAMAKATIRANRFIRANREEAVRILAEWGKVEREYAYASYDALRVLFNADGAVPEDGLRLVIDQARRNAKITREVMPADVVDLTLLRDAQMELGIKGR